LKIVDFEEENKIWHTFHTSHHSLEQEIENFSNPRSLSQKTGKGWCS